MKKLLLITACFFGLSYQTHAQIFYQDYIPDTVKNNISDHLIVKISREINSTYVSGDIYVIIWNEYTHVGIDVNHGNEIILDNTSTKPIASGELIDATGNWGQTVSFPYTPCSTWPIGTERYIGVRFKKNNQWHYGWVCMIRLQPVGVNNGFTVKDYAYNTIQNQGIKAGQKSSTGVNKVEANSISVNCYPNPSGNYISIDIPTKDNYSYYIYSAEGKLLLNGELVSSNKIDVSSLPSGNYSAILRSTETELHSKFIIQR